ncbi:MAG: hemK [Rickettsiaceae bacterium]|jgi:release factor glutamine methyltransferase|nr:hemK [Rickettsiaceae bacterium]
MKIKDALIHGAKRLSSYSSSAAIDSRVILGYILNYSTEQLVTKNDRFLEPNIITQYNMLIDHRIAGVPIAYITGEKEFYGRNFKVTPDVLIPRADTEIMIDAILKEYKSLAQPLRILELGVGSGCIIISLLLELQNASGIAVDISDEALKVAENNAKTHELNTRLKLLKSDWFANIKLDNFDIIVSNPPYIAQDEVDLLAQETKLFEPGLALFAEEKGLGNYRKIANQAANFLAPKGRIYLEIGFRQKQQVTQIFTENGFKLYQAYKDLAGLDRSLCFVK